jgi:predicted transglutaminase-like cysteine proteinase
VLAIALASTAASDAIGKTRNKIALQSPDAAAPVVLSSPAPAQYFTINDVLKKRDENAAARGPVRLASIDPLGLRSSFNETHFSDRLARGSDEPFGATTFRAPEGALWVKWRKVEDAVKKETELLARCRAEPDRCSSAAARRLVATIEDIESTRGRARLDTANRVINAAIRYTSDLVQHGLPDVWSSPLATFASGRGDCEDYAIAKYVALQQSGIASEDLKIVLAIDRSVGEAHAVLAARHEGAWFILDNLRPTVVEDKEISQFTPLFVLDRQGVKLLATRYTASSGQTHAPRGDAATPAKLEIGTGPSAEPAPAESSLVTVPSEF